MARPLIIFGAGASRDYSHVGQVSPLTNELVEERFMPTELLTKYDGAGDLLSEIAVRIEYRKEGFEAVLTDIWRRASSSRAKGQFAALEFYLQELFRRISIPDASRRSHEINNYRIIMNRINEYAGGQAAIVTFNYDTLFENVLGAETPKTMRDYTNRSIKLYKLHGSHDWHYVQPRQLMRQGSEKLTDYEWYRQNPQFLDDLRRKDAAPYHVRELQEMSDTSDYARFPAVAIPLTGKDEFLCPVAHVNSLKNELHSIDRILIIGWKAGDPLLLETLHREITVGQVKKVLVVSKTVESAREIALTVGEKIPDWKGRVGAQQGGFSRFVADESSHDFFQD